MDNCIRCGISTVHSLCYCYDCWKHISLDIEYSFIRIDLYEIEVYEMEELK